jgi:adenylate cyclase
VPAPTQRRLAGILSADAAGYSRLMAGDEAGTVRLLAESRELMRDRVARRGGRVVDAPGDNLLAEFPSVVDAVACAAEIQRELGRRASDLPPERRLLFRIGVNLGDVLVEGDRIYGDGVNVAARLEGLAEPGGICVSGGAFDQVEGKLPLRFESGGEHAVKNIPKPVRVYRVRPGPAPARASGTGERRRWPRRLAAGTLGGLLLLALAAALTWPRPLGFLVGLAGLSGPPVRPPLPGKPSLALLPIANLSGDPEQEYLADALTMELVAGLGANPSLFVISGLTSLSYKGAAASVEEVAREVGVRYVLQGAVLRSGPQVRVTATLTDATTGVQLWSQRYNRALGDLVSLESEIASEILAAVGVKIDREEQRRIRGRPEADLGAYDAYLKAQSHLFRFRREGNARARGLLQRAVELDPENASAWALLGGTHLLEYGFGWSVDRELLDRAEEFVGRALELDPLASEAHTALAGIRLWEGRSSEAVAAAERAVELAPNSDRCYAMRGAALAANGEYLAAARSLRRALRLNPRSPAPYWILLAYLNARSGRMEDAVRLWESVREANADDLLSRIELAVYYGGSASPEEASTLVREILEVNPALTAESAAELRARTLERGDTEAAAASLRRAGLP